MTITSTSNLIDSLRKIEKFRKVCVVAHFVERLNYILSMGKTFRGFFFGTFWGIFLNF